MDASGTLQDLVLSGHMHRFQLVDFSNATFPGRFVVGNDSEGLAKQHLVETATLKKVGMMRE